MLPVKLTLKGIGPYLDETIDFSGINGNVIAITGENGSGKTFLFDSVFAALYRYFPSRDSIYGYCRGKDAQITLDFRVGSVDYQSVLNINATKREMEPWLFRTKEPITDGKNSTFDKEIERICGPAGVVLTSVFSAQTKMGSFGKLSKADRKTLFISMLGQEKLQKVSDIASSLEATSSAKYDQMSDLIEVHRGFIDTKGIDLESMRVSLEIIRADISRYELSVREKQTVVIDLKGKVLSTADIEGQRFPLLKRKQVCDKDLIDTKRVIDESLKLIGELDALRSGTVRHDEIIKDLKNKTDQISGLLVEQSDHHRKVTSYQEVIHDLETKLSTQKELSRRSQTALKRAGDDSAIISTVPCKAEKEFAKCQFLLNAVKAKDSLEELETTIVNCRAQALAIEDQIKGVTKPDGERLISLEKRISILRGELKEGEAELKKLNFSKDRLNKAESASTVLLDLQPRLTRLSGDSENICAEITVLDAKLKTAKISASELTKAETDLDVEGDLLDGSRAQFSQALVDLSRAESVIESAAKAQEEIAKLQGQLVILDQDRKSYNLLAKAFGKVGIQSLEIDAAGPAISQIVNDLLFSCFGPRFSIRFLTQVLKDDKKGWKDEFDVYVSDSKSGREGSIDDLSGGERTLVSEALSLGISLFNRSRSNIGWESLWRDEASSALDDRRAPQYLLMLRKARELGHFDRLFFISHQARVNSTADSRINVTDGHTSEE